MSQTRDFKKSKSNRKIRINHLILNNFSYIFLHYCYCNSQRTNYVPVFMRWAKFCQTFMCDSFIDVLQQTKSYLIYFIAYKTLFSNRMTTSKSRKQFYTKFKSELFCELHFFKKHFQRHLKKKCVFSINFSTNPSLFFSNSISNFFFEFSIQSIAYFFRHTKYYKRFLINKLIGNRNGSQLVNNS